MTATKIISKALASAALKTAEKSTGFNSSFFFNQPKMPKKLMKTGK